MCTPVELVRAYTAKVPLQLRKLSSCMRMCKAVEAKLSCVYRCTSLAQLCAGINMLSTAVYAGVQAKHSCVQL